MVTPDGLPHPEISYFDLKNPPPARDDRRRCRPDGLDPLASRDRDRVPHHRRSALVVGAVAAGGLRLPRDASLEVLLDGQAFFPPSRLYFDPLIRQPSTPVECCLRLMF
jgi:hypothetical protein